MNSEYVIMSIIGHTPCTCRLQVQFLNATFKTVFIQTMTALIVPICCSRFACKN